MVQSPSWEANWFAASQETPRISRNPKVHYRTHKRPPPIPILGQPNPVHIPTSHLLEIHPNIIHPSTPRSPQWSPYIHTYSYTFFPEEFCLLYHSQCSHSIYFDILHQQFIAVKWPNKLTFLWLIITYLCLPTELFECVVGKTCFRDSVAKLGHSTGRSEQASWIYWQ